MSFFLAIVALIALIAASLTVRARLRPTGLVARRNLDDLAQWLSTPADELLALQPSYRVVHIPKRSGGTRTLHIPDDRTMALQRRVHARLLRPLRVHPAAMAYERGRGPVHNAAAHSWQAVVIKLDLVDFFPSTSSERVHRYFRGLGWDPQAADVLTKLTTVDGGLPQGAPTSPALCNRVNYLFDADLNARVSRFRGTYTRYADDITVSFPVDYPRHVRGALQVCLRVAHRFGYQVHTGKKRQTLRRHQRQLVTGLVVNDGPQLTRTRRRWLRAVRHAARTGRPTTLGAGELRGWSQWERQAAELRDQERQRRTLELLDALATEASTAAAAWKLGMSPNELRARAKWLGLEV